MVLGQENHAGYWKKTRIILIETRGPLLVYINSEGARNSYAFTGTSV